MSKSHHGRCPQCGTRLQTAGYPLHCPRPDKHKKEAKKGKTKKGTAA